MPSGRQGAVPLGTNLLDAARMLGVELESICGGKQTCGKCQIVVMSGRFPKLGIDSAADHVTPFTTAEAQYDETEPLNGRRLACACEVIGDLLITVPEESQARKQIIAKAATDRVIDVRPAVRQIYVEAIEADMDDVRGDWERLQAAVAEQWGLDLLSIDLNALVSLQPALKKGKLTVTLTLWHDREVLRVEPGYSESVFGLAVDVGSTTVAAHLCDLRTGELRATESAMNPQVRYGEDLMSRVSYAMMNEQGVTRMHRAIIRTLNELVERAAESAEISKTDILDIVLVGNPVMEHLFLGIDPVELGGTPFALAFNGALDLKAREMDISINPAGRVHILPAIAGHVGADNVAVQIAEAPHRSEELVLIVDVGTNAEIVLGDQDQVLCASSPTGPAFEGAQISHGQRAAPGAIERVRIDRETLEPSFKVIGSEEWVIGAAPAEIKPTGICGSGIIEAVAEMYLAGALGADGRIVPSSEERYPRRIRSNGRSLEYVLVTAEQSATEDEIVVTQNDIRQIQLGKAALYAGAKLLMLERGVTTVERIILAGAFGSFISPVHAMVLGLIPDCELDNVTAVGNAAGDGARIALLDKTARDDAAAIAENAIHVQTATATNFQEVFVAAMNLPHASDPYPHLEDILPKATDIPVEDRPGRKRRRRRAAVE